MKKSNFIRAIIDALGMGGVLWLTAVVNAPPTLAAADLTYNGQTIYKDSKDNIYNVGASNDVTYRGVEVRTTSTSDACGYLRLTLRDSSSTFPATLSVNGTSFSLNNIPNRTKNPYKCKNGVISWDGSAPTDNFQVTTSNSRSVTISNTCGMANLTYREMPTSIKVGGNT